MNARTFALQPAQATPVMRKSSQADSAVNDVLPKQPGANKPTNKKLLAAAVISLVLLAVAVGAFQWMRYIGAYESTDDAYIQGHLHQISARINGTVQNVLVDDNQHVKAGETLLTLDPRDLQVKVQQAKAALETARCQAQAAKSTITLAATSAEGQSTQALGGVSNSISTISRAEAQVQEAQSAVPMAHSALAQREAELKQAEQDFTRYAQLEKEGAVSKQLLDNATRTLEVAREAKRAAYDGIKQAQARLKQCQDAVESAKAQLTQAQGQVQQAKASSVQTEVNQHQYSVANANIAEAQAALDDALLQLSYTNVTAPTSGRVGRKTVEAGQRVQPGQALMTIVADDLWVVANFKETQLENMHPGQAVSITVDSFAHHKFTGTVDSIAPGSGATFALLPPDNATGNFTKIVQRVPVKVRFDQKSINGFESSLVPGMSVVAQVKVQ